MSAARPEGTNAGIRAVVVVGMVSVAALMIALFGGTEDNLYEYAPESLANGLVWAVLGALILRRDRRNTIGWIFFAGGLVSGGQLLFGQYATYGLASATRFASTAAWLSDALQAVIVGVFILLLVLFPSGRPFRGFGVLPWMGGCAILLGVAIELLAEGRVDNFPAVDSPIGILSGAPLRLLTDLMVILFIGTLIGSIVALFVRLRRAAAIERAQVKLFLLAGLGGILMIVLSGIVAPPGAEDEFGTAGWTLAGLSLPAATGVAILRHRLYDIDVIINRALVYTTLTAVLVGAYGGGVLLFRALLDPLTGDNDIAIAASTLAVAALFGPARRRIQAFIDRRLYRSRYDARRTLEAFGTRLRDEVELEMLTGDLLGVVRGTVAPRHASLWLAKEAR